MSLLALTFAVLQWRNLVGHDPRVVATQEIDARGRLYVPVERAEVKLRYRSPAVSADVAATETGFRLHMDEPAYGAAPGQAAVLYEDGAVVGAGTIRVPAGRNPGVRSDVEVNGT